MYINWILKSRNPRNSNLVQNNQENNYFSIRIKLEATLYALLSLFFGLLSILNYTRM